MTPLFLVSSALHTRFGVFTLEQRINQTVDTLNSIKHAFPSARIVLSESSGGGEITQEEVAGLPYLDEVIVHSNNPEIVKIYNECDREDIVKNKTELLATIKALEFLMGGGLVHGCDRIFKLSGRYIIRSDFRELNNYDDDRLSKAIVIAQARASQLDPYLTDSQALQYMCRCWSFPSAIIEEMRGIYLSMYSKFVEVNRQGKYLDLEHLLYMFLNGRTGIVEVPFLGAMGALGSSGERVID